MSDTTNDIDALLLLLSQRKTNGCYFDQRYHAALTALVTERDNLKQRVAEQEAKPPADRDRELRERLVCAALTGLCADPRHDVAEEVAVAIADRTLAAMRKGEQ